MPRQMNHQILTLLILSLLGKTLFAQEKGKQLDSLVIQKSLQSISTAIQEKYVYPDKALLITN